MAELAAVEGHSLDQLVRGLFARHGALVSRRVQLPLKERTRAAIEKVSGRSFKEYAGQKVTRVDRRDGILLELADGSWVLARAAQTEPKLRIYAEATSSSQLRTLVRETRALIRGAEEGVAHVRN
jgi:phosphomannomutase